MTFCKVNDCSRTVTFRAEVDSGFCVEHLDLHIADLRTQAEVAAKSRDVNVAKLAATTIERNALSVQVASAHDAIAYVLRRVGEDAEFAYHMLFTETLDRLIRAHAILVDSDPVAIREDITARARALPKSRCAADREFIADGGRI